MENLFLADIPNSAKKSTETIYEIKAPLATFDTIDLDDDEISRKSVKSNESTPTAGSVKLESNEGAVKDIDVNILVETVNDSLQLSKPVVENHSDSANNSKVKDKTRGNNKSSRVKNSHNAITEDNKISNSEVPTEKSNLMEHAVSSVKSKLGRILSPKSDSKSKAAERKSKTEEINRDKKLNIAPLKLSNDIGKDLESPTPTEETPHLDNASLNTLNSESDNNTPDCAPAFDLVDPNSSENNASAEDIQLKLKQKAKKHREKASNVKYEKIGSLSDISDQERSENATPVSDLKLKSKAYDSDSDSSDSDSGYIRRGYIANVKGIGPQHLRSIVGGSDNVDSDSTPCSSPKISRPLVPPPLSKEDAAKISKRKAYEKRLQRLQVTTTPIERPRSTTPINIHCLEEYVSISSPEKSPAKGSLEKLKIKLPLDDVGRMGHRRCVSGDGHAFNFNEELLFTHTKSAILLEDNGNQTHSPKRILVPPTLSPKLSPAHLVKSPRGISALDPNHPPKYFFNPKSPQPGRNTESGTAAQNGSVDNERNENTNWAKFDDFDFTTKESEIKELDLDVASQANDLATQDNFRDNWIDTDCQNNSNSKQVDVKDEWVDVDKEVANAFEESFEDELNADEILTIKIVENGGTRKCDIECHAKEEVPDDQSKTNDIKLDEIELDGIEPCEIGEKLIIEEDLNIKDSVNCEAVHLDEDINSLC